MKTRIKNLLTCLGVASMRSRVLSSVVAGLGLLPVGRLHAQTFTTVYSFPAAPPPPGPETNGDGAYPAAGFALSGDTLYGTTFEGGSSGFGTVFAVNTDGTGFRSLHTFTGSSDGSAPNGSLVLSSNTLYGTATGGGTSDAGTVFAVNTDGSGFTVLHDFTGGSDGANPNPGLAVSGNTLYGTANAGGVVGGGTIFAVNTDGTGFMTAYSFTNGTDGASPYGGLVLSGDTLYGTTSQDPSLLGGGGTVFSMQTDGTHFVTLHSLSGYDGSLPVSALILSGNTLYGTTEWGGTGTNGTAFALSTDGSTFKVLHNFTGGILATDIDGELPMGKLFLSGNTLYGTAWQGGVSGAGTVWAVNTDGTGFVILHYFTDTGDGIFPYGGLLLLGNTVYGTTQFGGTSGAGNVFTVSLAPQLSINPAGSNVILTWPTNLAGVSYAGYGLQSTANLVPSAVWNPVSLAPVIVDGQYTVTNPVSGNQQFYRLTQ
jgi:uncharacterized repeat protein (TIGR03803 family)